MSGIAAYYLAGGSGGYMGADGLNGGVDFYVELWVGHREAFAVNYVTYNYLPMSLSLKSFVPYEPFDTERKERTMAILFASNLFAECPSFEKVRQECEGVERIDFNLGTNVPEHFEDLYEESKKVKLPERFHLYFANLQSVFLRQEV